MSFPKPPQNHFLIRPGITIQADDLYWQDSTSSWIPTISEGQQVKETTIYARPFQLGPIRGPNNDKPQTPTDHW